MRDRIFRIKLDILKCVLILEHPQIVSLYVSQIASNASFSFGSETMVAVYVARDKIATAKYENLSSGVSSFLVGLVSHQPTSTLFFHRNLLINKQFIYNMKI